MIVKDNELSYSESKWKWDIWKKSGYTQEVFDPETEEFI